MVWVIYHLCLWKFTDNPLRPIRKPVMINKEQLVYHILLGCATARGTSHYDMLFSI